MNNNTEEKEVPGKEISENISKSKCRVRCKKRKRQDSENSSDGNLPENTLETEKNLHASAIKNNLDEVSVKKILKKVVTNDHVLALVKLREEEEDSGTEEGLRPKLTRAKAKELKKISPSGPPWNLELTPIKHIPVKTRPEVTALIAQELPDDEDDEEYEPTHDDIPSDDDHVLESSSDLDSQPRTPATPKSLRKDSPTVVKDGPFKVPQEVTTPVRKKLNLEEEAATIALRTRSKLSLSATPIEHIESSFVPPDELPMPDVDDLWNQFLNECLNPASSARNEDDPDELDPEYNVAADPDAHEEDEETLEKSIIKISKKELNDLFTELMNVMPSNSQLSDVQGDLFQDNGPGVLDPGGKNLEGLGAGANVEVPTHWEGKQEPISDDEIQCTSKSKLTFEASNIMPRVSIGKTEIEDEDEGNNEAALNGKEAVTSEVPTTAPSAVPTTCAGSRTITISVEEREQRVSDAPAPAAKPPPALLRLLGPDQPLQLNIEVHEDVKMSAGQVSILQQQLRQHVQLSVSSFLQLYVHPMHWSYAPAYKGYLEAFSKILESNPRSVVNVCNLRPALELLDSWEKSVSENTPENVAMVQFIQEEAEKCRRRSAGNSVYISDFPELFKKVIANSQVFLYPYLLPPMPYRAVSNIRRFNYLKSEDELIVLGLEQFWWYVENNPELFRPPHRLHPRRRWGFSTTVSLVCKHMLPWLSPKALLGHIQSVRKIGDKSSPIVKYFTDKTIEPVKHIILPFNPKLTLYEHPEIEMPRIWIKYLAKTSKRFKHHSSRRYNIVQPPMGIEVRVGKAIEPVEKQPLPIDFIKPISCNRINILPKVPKPVLTDKVDVHINSGENASTDTSFLIASNLFTLVNTSTGAKLVPLKVLPTNTVNSANAPICSPAVVQTNNVTTNLQLKVTVENNTEIAQTDKNSIINKNELERRKKANQSSKHCTCCVYLRKLCKIRQALITDYFKCKNDKKDKKKEECQCTNQKYPKITNKLKLLVNNYRNLSSVIYAELLHKIKTLDVEKRIGLNVENRPQDESSNDFSFNDFAAAISFQTKLLVRTGIIRNTAKKKSLHLAFSKFDIKSDDPVILGEKLYKIFDVEMADMYKEFLGFLTAEQADRIGHFKEYFIRNCAEDLIKKIEEQVGDIQKRHFILKQLKGLFICKSFSPCEICFTLLLSLQDYPELAKYVFSLFPHRRKGGKAQNIVDPINFDILSECGEAIPPLVDEEANDLCDLTESACEITEDNYCKETNANEDYEADNSCSEEELEVDINDKIDNEPEMRDEEERVPLVTTIKDEPFDTSELTVTKTEVQEKGESSDMSMLIMSEDESIKSEPPEWTRDEDKLILEILKQYLTPEERSDKTIIEIIKEKDLMNIISNNLSNKSFEDVTERVLYVLQILVLSDCDN